jgi:hypothetical protein
LLQLAMLANLALYAVVASQPIFYAVALSDTTAALQAPAYVEVRNAVNTVMKRRLPALYVLTLVACLTVLVLALRSGERLVAITSGVALLALFVDAGFMLAVNVPINTAIESWTPTNYPADWQVHRARWAAALAWRQLATISGFASLLVGAVFRS